MMRFVSYALGAPLAFLLACSAVNAPDDPQPANSDGTGGATPEGCPSGFELCAGACVDTTNNPAHCGACDSACAESEVCGSGQCLSACTGGTVDCDGACVDLQSDTANCGTCGNVCDAANANNTCDSGACNFACVSGFDDCDGDRANGCEQDIDNDPAHCGECGTVCLALANAGAACAGGACTLGPCNAGFDDCDGAPATGCETQIATDDLNCTACNMACGGGQLCANGCKDGVRFSADQTGGVPTTPAICDDWNAFRASLTAGSYDLVRMRGTFDQEGVTCNDAAAATQICQALNTETNVTVSCGGRSWNVFVGCGEDHNTNPSVELNVDNTGCQCQSPGYTIRACYHPDQFQEWGGVNSDTCSTITQNYEVTCIET